MEAVGAAGESYKTSEQHQAQDVSSLSLAKVTGPTSLREDGEVWVQIDGPCVSQDGQGDIPREGAAGWVINGVGGVVVGGVSR